MLYDQKENCFLIGSDNFHVPLCLLETSHILCLEVNILSVNEKLPVMKFRYFGKYIIQPFGYCYVHVSGQQQAGLER